MNEVTGFIICCMLLPFVLAYTFWARVLPIYRQSCADLIAKEEGIATEDIRKRLARSLRVTGTVWILFALLKVVGSVCAVLVLGIENYGFLGFFVDGPKGGLAPLNWTMLLFGTLLALSLALCGVIICFRFSVALRIGTVISVLYLVGGILLGLLVAISTMASRGPSSLAMLFGLFTAAIQAIPLFAGLPSERLAIVARHRDRVEAVPIETHAGVA